MTNLILIGGFALAILLAIAMVRPRWRLPALVMALLALPGNIDNVWPQMTLDPNPIADNLAPVFTTADLLMVWCLALAFRERRSVAGRIERGLVFGAIGVAVLATIAALWAALGGVELQAAIRGTVTFARIPAILFLVFTHRSVLGDGRLLAAAFAAGVVGLIGNGLYTSASLDLVRFTASTFGRNGFAVALVVGGLLTGALALQLADERVSGALRRWAPIALGAVAAAAFFGAAATGTRMALLALPVACLVAIAINRTWWRRGQWLRLTAAAVVIVISVAAAGLLTAEGGRALSVVTDPGRTVDIIVDPGSEPVYSPIRTRTTFWEQAATMIRQRPLTGVGPFQWNVERYRIDPAAPAAVADTHNTFLQMAAEYGLVVTAAYLVLLLSTLGMVLLFALQRASLGATRWTATGIVVIALVFPLTEATNSHFFHVRLGPVAWILFAAAVVLAGTSLAGERLALRLSGRETVREPAGRSSVAR